MRDANARGYTRHAGEAAASRTYEKEGALEPYLDSSAPSFSQQGQHTLTFYTRSAVLRRSSSCS
jgi:hypothetical protein